MQRQKRPLGRWGVHQPPVPARAGPSSAGSPDRCTNSDSATARGTQRKEHAEVRVTHTRPLDTAGADVALLHSDPVGHCTAAKENEFQLHGRLGGLARLPQTVPTTVTMCDSAGATPYTKRHYYNKIYEVKTGKTSSEERKLGPGGRTCGEGRGGAERRAGGSNVTVTVLPSPWVG